MRWHNVREAYKQKLLEHRKEYTSEKHYKAIYNYMSGDTKELWEKIYQAFWEKGYKKADVKKRLYAKGIPTKDIEEKFSGKRPFTMYEFLDLIKYLNIELDVKFNFDKEYKFTTQANRLIIDKRSEPKLLININMDDLYDFEVDFTKFKSVTLSPTNATNIFIATLNMYFVEHLRNKGKLPYNLQKMKRTFKDKFFLNKMIEPNNKII